FFAELQAGWAAFNGRSLIRSGATSLDNFTVSPTSASPRPASGQAPTRQEFFQEQYRRQPYLRALSDEQVLAQGSTVYGSLLPYFLVGGPRVPFEQLDAMMVLWSDFLCEAEH